MTDAKDKFEANNWYRVKREWHQDINPQLRTDRIMAHDLNVGDVLMFRGPNLGMANFLDKQGRVAILSPRDAFKTFDTEPPVMG